MERSYARFYAIRELRARPKTFLPLFAICFGVMLLMGNLLIYAQCQRTSDAAYYRVETQLILPDLTDGEVDALRQMAEIRQVDAVKVDGGYIAYVELIDRLATDPNAICTMLPTCIERLQLQDRSTAYEVFMRNYAQNPAYAYDHTNMINSAYVDALRETAFAPETLLLVFVAALVLFAAVVLVYAMKLSRSRKEYACLMGLGLTRRGIWAIQMWQGFWLITLGYVPSQLLAILSMKVVSVLSTRIYPHFRGNTVLLFDVPWLLLLILYGVNLLAVALGIFVCLRAWKGQTLTGLLNDSGTKISFVAESARKFLSSGSFDGYGAIWQKRNRKTIRPMLVLFLCLLLFPSLLAGICLVGMASGEQRDMTAIVSVIGTNKNEGRISFALLEDFASIPGVSHLSTSTTVGHRRQIEGAVRYDSSHGFSAVTDRETVSVVPLVATFLMEESPTDGTVWVSPDFPGDVGDTMQIGSVTAVIEQKTEELRSSPNAWEDYMDYPVLLPLSLSEALFGEPITGANCRVTVQSDLPDEEIDGLLSTLFTLVGDDSVYLNEHDRYLRSTREQDVLLTNLYYQNRVANIKNTFMGLFLLTQTVYLLLCAAVVIGGTLGFQLDRRRGEYAVLRALGLSDASLQRISDRFCRPLFRYGIPILYPIMVVLISLLDDTITIVTEPYLHMTGTHNFVEYVISYGILSVLLYLLYATTARHTSRKTTSEMLAVPLAVAVKERE